MVAGKTGPKTFALLLACCSPFALAVSPATAARQLCDAPPGTETPVVRETTLAGVPAILRVPAHIRRPPIILWHGFGPPASERAMMEALPLDDVEAVKVYLGLPLFGARAPKGGMKELARRQAEDVGLQVFKPVVVGAGDELPGVVAALRKASCVQRDAAIDLVGFSAGGAAVLYSLAQGKVRVDAAVLINTSTGLSASVQAYEHATRQAYVWSAASRELARETDALERAGDIGKSRPALLFISGAADTVVDSETISALYDKLKPYYGKDAARIRWSPMPTLSHQWAAQPQSLADVRKVTAAWLTTDRGLP